MSAAPAIRFAGITKRFPGVIALDEVSFEIAAGSCHAICGENGAGKSTLGKILAGIHRPDHGHVEIAGAAVRLTSPRAALRAGVAMVQQELELCDNLTVAENLCLGDLPRRFGFVDVRAARLKAEELLAAIDARIDPRRTVASLRIAEQQIVQIAGAVGAAARIIVFDEPTSSLAEAEAEHLYALIARLRAQGMTIVYVSHRMPEIFRLCDRVTVLRDGRHVSTTAMAELNEARLVHDMIGRTLDQYFPGHLSAQRGAVLLQVEKLSSPGHFADVSFHVHAGEVVGLAGLVGAGRSEVARALFGLDPGVTGRVLVDGQPVALLSPAAAMAHGISLVPEDRKRQGLVIVLSAGHNATLPTLKSHARFGWIDREHEQQTTSHYFQRLRIKAEPRTPTAALSGGNQQKLVLAKWLAANGRILVLDEPTRGVDVGAKAELHAWIDRLAADGKAILLISSELPELMHLSSRILVLRAGRLIGEVQRADATQERLLRMMTGLSGQVS